MDRVAVKELRNPSGLRVLRALQDSDYGMLKGIVCSAHDAMYLADGGLYLHHEIARNVGVEMWDNPFTLGIHRDEDDKEIIQLQDYSKVTRLVPLFDKLGWKYTVWLPR